MKIEKVYSLASIMFQREEGSVWEKGLLINEGERIYDMKGEQPDGLLWDFKRITGIKFSSNLDRISTVDFNPQNGSLQLEVVIE